MLMCLWKIDADQKNLKKNSFFRELKDVEEQL